MRPRMVWQFCRVTIGSMSVSAKRREKSLLVSSRPQALGRAGLTIALPVVVLSAQTTSGGGAAPARAALARGAPPDNGNGHQPGGAQTLVLGEFGHRGSRTFTRVS